ncbi:hypothetical protein GTY57_01290, partial [Streptomyces sp. SID5475]|nr:hypothetical protein [Streptomyces sp. SID5475]
MPGPSAAVELIMGFTNTVDMESGRDELATPAGLARWLAAAGLVERPPGLTEAGHRACLDLRTGMREALDDGGAPASPHRLALADAVLARLPVTVTLPAACADG